LALQQYCLGQGSQLRGELRYEHQYQDFLPEKGGLATSLRQGPAINLNLLGSFLSARILTYSLFSSLAYNFNTSNTPSYNTSNTLYNWNTYNLIVNVLPYSRAKLDFSARENVIDTKSVYEIINTHGRTRQQEQSISLSVDQVPSLPTMTLGYIRNRSWAPVGERSEQLSQQYSLVLSASNGPTAYVGLSGSLNDVVERYTNFHERLLSINLTGSKQFTDHHRMNMNADYHQFTSYSNFTGSVGYSGMFGDKVRITSGISGLSYSNTSAIGWTGGFSEGIIYMADQNFQLGLTVNGSSGLTRSIISSNVITYPNSTWGGNATLQSNRSMGSSTISNGLSFGYLVQNYFDGHRTFNGVLSNSLQIPVGSFSVTGDYSFSYSQTQNSDRWSSIGNRISLVLIGTLPRQIRSNTTLRYNDDHYMGDVSSFRNQRNLMFNQRFDASLFYIIPLTIGVGGSVNWYFSNIKGQTHSWHISINSPAFFLQGLFASYVYSRNFDPYFRSEVTEQNGSFMYQWRALSLQARVRNINLPIRTRDFWFSVSRPF
jgi:hypothetical protein